MSPWGSVGAVERFYHALKGADQTYLPVPDKTCGKVCSAESGASAGLAVTVIKVNAMQILTELYSFEGVFSVNIATAQTQSRSVSTSSRHQEGIGVCTAARKLPDIHATFAKNQFMHSQQKIILESWIA